MRQEVAIRRIEAFERRFGKLHLYLAYHAAFPLALTPDLLYRLWANFRRDIHGEPFDHDLNGRPLYVPWIAVADLLLSGLCEEVGYELYEMPQAIRDVLVDRLKHTENLGKPRIKELSQFLLDYIQQSLYSTDIDTQDFAKAQRWTALAYTRPSVAARELALALQSSQHDITEQLRISSIVETAKTVEDLADPLTSQLEPLLTYAQGITAYAQGRLEEASDRFSTVERTGNQTRIADVVLPIPIEVLPEPETPEFPIEPVKIFISYAPEDEELKTELMAHLQAALAEKIVLVGNQSAKQVGKHLTSERRQELTRELEVLTERRESLTKTIEGLKRPALPLQGPFFEDSIYPESNAEAMLSIREIEKAESLLRETEQRRAEVLRLLDAMSDVGETNLSGYIDASQLILLLISPHYLASDELYDVEMARAMERHEATEAVVIPVILRPTDWRDSPVRKLNALPSYAVPVTTWENRTEAFENIVRGITKVVDGIIDPEFPEEPGEIEPTQVYISYAYRDNELEAELVRALADLETQELITIWDDSRLKAGSDWDAAIQNQLELADIFLFLISADSLASKFIQDVEVPKAIERYNRGEALIIPIVILPAYWEKTVFSQLMPLPSDARPVTAWEDRNQAYKNITQGLISAISGLRNPTRSVQPIQPISSISDSPIEVYCSYTHEDEALKEALIKHLASLERQGLIYVWHGRLIEAGTNWREEMETHLNNAEIILFLISSNSLQSAWVQMELTRAIDRHNAKEVHLIPILLEPCEWRRSPLTRFQMLPRNGRPISNWGMQDEAWVEVVKEIQGVAEAIAATKAREIYLTQFWSRGAALLRTFEAHRVNVTCVCFSSDDRMIASSSDDQTIRLCDLEGNVIRQFQGAYAIVNSFMFSPDGQFIISGSSDGMIRLWSLDGTLIRDWQADWNEVQSVAFSSNGQLILSGGSDRRMKLWNQEGILLHEFIQTPGEVFQTSEEEILSVAFSPDTKYAVSGDRGGTFQLWDLESRNLLLTTGLVENSSISRIACSPDGKVAYSANAVSCVYAFDDLELGNKILTKELASTTINSIAFSPDGKLIASAHEDGVIQILYVHTGKSVCLALRGHEGAVKSVVFSSGGNCLISGGADGTVRIWSNQDTTLESLLQNLSPTSVKTPPSIDIRSFYQATNLNALDISREVDRYYYIADEYSVRQGNVQFRWIEQLLPNDTNIGNQSCTLMTGQIGCGKTTELLRSKFRLEQRGFHVVYIQVSQVLGLSEVDVWDVLLTIIHQVATDLITYQFSFSFERVRTFLQEAIDILWINSELLPEVLSFLQNNREVSVDPDLGAFADILRTVIRVLRENPSLKYALHQYLQSQADDFTEAINAELMYSAIQNLQEQGKRGLVVIVDELDRFLVSESERSQARSLFVDQSPWFRRLSCHTILTFPLAVAMSPVSAEVLGQFYSFSVLSTIPIQQRDGSVFELGLQMLRQMVLARAFPDLAEAERLNRISEICDAEDLDRLCFMSGGNPRQLFALLRNWINESALLPLSHSALEQVIRDQRQNLMMSLNDGDWTLLAEVGETKEIGRDERYTQLISSRHIYFYDLYQEPRWFDVNPLLQAEVLLTEE